MAGDDRLMVSVSGVRGTIGATLTPQVACDFGCALAAMLGAGSKVVLARDTRPSGPMVRNAVAAGLLATEDRELLLAALNNPFLTEAHLTKVLALDSLPEAVVETIANHEKWSHRYYLRLAMIRNRRTPFQQVLAFIPDMTVPDLREICLDRRMPEQVRKYIIAHCAERLSKRPPGS